ncbi:MAG: hypothetical protein NTY50_19315 [Methylobacter sp.]|nr:hypothetical protein [Methylobacter sp.]
MNIKNILPRGFSIMGMMLVYGISISAQAASVAIIPPNPTDHEAVIMGIYGVEGTSCVPANAQVSFSENVIHVDFPPIPDGTGCFEAFTPWGEMVWLDHELPEGAYDVIVTRGEVEQLARHSFRVQNSPSTSTSIKLQQVECKNLTTGKKKVINNPSSSWNCEAAGLKMHPGDKIEQILQGTAKKKR